MSYELSNCKLNKEQITKDNKMKASAVSMFILLKILFILGRNYSLHAHNVNVIESERTYVCKQVQYLSNSQWGVRSANCRL